MNNPKLVDVYRSKSKRTCYEQMRRLGLNYVYVPSYSSPLITNTHLFEVLGDSSLSSLCLSFGGYRLYQLVDDASLIAPSVHASERDMSGLQWTSFDVPAIRGASRPIAMGRLPVYIDSSSSSGGRALYSGVGLLPLSPRNCFDSFPIEPEGAYTVSYSMSGHGLYAVHVVFYDRRGRCIGGTKLVDGVLDSSYRVPREMCFQFVAPTPAAQCRLVCVLTGEGRLTLHDARLVEEERERGRRLMTVVYGEEDMGAPPSSQGVVFMDPLSAVSDKSESLIRTMLGEDGGQGGLVPDVMAGGTLYTGPGDPEAAPLAVRSKRVVCRLGGVGLVDISLRCYSSRYGVSGGYHEQPLGVFLLPGDDEDAVVDAVLDLPSVYDDYRVLIKPVSVIGLNHLAPDAVMVGKVELRELTIYENRAQGLPLYGLEGEGWAKIYSLGADR